MRNATRNLKGATCTAQDLAAPRAAQTAEDATGTGDPADDEKRVALINGIQDITNALLENCALNDVLVMVLETMFRGFGFTRVILCILDSGQRRMAARFGLGKDIDQLMPRFQFRLGSQKDAFTAAVNGQRDVVFPDQCALADVPPWHRKLVSAASFILLPVTVNGVCVGLVYCDFESLGKRVTGEQLNYLNTLRKQAALAIKQRS